MTSLLRFKKQIPSDTPYFYAASSFTGKQFIKDSGNVSNYGPGRFSTATAGNITQGSILRDLGKTIVSANRAFRYVQLINTNLNGVTTSSANGITGAESTVTDGSYSCWYAEVPLNGMCPVAGGNGTDLLVDGAPDPIVRYG
jgi:hypothetical protein